MPILGQQQPDFNSALTRMMAAMGVPGGGSAFGGGGGFPLANNAGMTGISNPGAALGLPVSGSAGGGNPFARGGMNGGGLDWNTLMQMLMSGGMSGMGGMGGGMAGAGSMMPGLAGLSSISPAMSGPMNNRFGPYR